LEINGLGLGAQEMHEVFAEWNKGELDSYLIRNFPATFSPTKTPTARRSWTKFSTTAGQKGTGKWTVQNSADLASPSR